MPALSNPGLLVTTTKSSPAQPAAYNGLSVDTRSLDALKAKAGADPKAAAREAARQFEALFMGELLKSMRQSTQATGMLDNAGTQLGTELLDKQLSGQVSGRPGGLGEAILRHLERQMGLPGPIPVAAAPSANNSAVPWRPQKAGEPAPAISIPQVGAAGFVQQHMKAAQSAEAATGLPASFMVSQAALETGWGRKEIRHSDGSTSHNLFGIKAGGSWRGPVAEVTTTEFIDGKATKVVAKFRAYSNYAESFADYARLMTNSPRYHAVIKGARQAQEAGTEGASAAFAQNLQRAGYATDPAYADKLTRVINTTLRLQRSPVA